MPNMPRKILKNYMSIHPKFYNYDLSKLFEQVKMDTLINGFEIIIDDYTNLYENECINTLINFLRDNNRDLQLHGANISDITEPLLEYYNNLAQKFGNKIKITIHPSNEDSLNFKLFEKLFETINTKKYDLKILAENLNLMRFSLKHIETLLNQFDDLYWCFDIGHAVYDNEKIKFSKKMLNKIKNIHIHDIINEYDHVPFYKNGIVDYIKLISFLDKTGYDDSIVSEIALDYLSGDTFEEKLVDYKKNIKMLCYRENFRGNVKTKKDIVLQINKDKK